MDNANATQNHVASLRKESHIWRVVLQRTLSCVCPVRNLASIREKDLQPYLATEIRYCLQKVIIFNVFKVFLPIDQSSNYILKMEACSSPFVLDKPQLHKMLRCESVVSHGLQTLLLVPLEKVVSEFIYQDPAVFFHILLLVIRARNRHSFKWLLHDKKFANT